MQDQQPEPFGDHTVVFFFDESDEENFVHIGTMVLGVLVAIVIVIALGIYVAWPYLPMVFSAIGKGLTFIR